MKVIRTKMHQTPSYTLLDADSIKVDSIIPFNIFIKRDEDYVSIVEVNTFIFQELYVKLKKQKNLYINKEDESKQILSCETLRYHIKYNLKNIQKALQMLYDVNSQLFDTYLNNKENKISLACVELIVKSIIYVVKNDDTFLRTAMPHFLNDDKLPNHSLHVAIYAIKLGELLNLNVEKLLKLGTAALLHDIGYKKIDSSIIDKTTPFTAHDTKEIHKHSQLSVEIIKQNHIFDPYILDAVMHHHECYDGSGYPEGLKKDDISEFASILAICDVFDALTNNRPYRKGYCSFDALKMMMKDPSMINKFNQQYLLVALKAL